MSAPATSALAMSPEYCRPPSPISGTPAGRQAREALWIAVTCGTPTPATTRVVQMEPGPTPTLTPSAPASTRALAPAYGRHVPADDVDLRRSRIRLQPAHHFQYALGMAVRGVDYQQVGTFLDQRHRPLPGVAEEPDGCPDPESSLIIFGGVGYIPDLTKSLSVIRPLSRS